MDISELKQGVSACFIKNSRFKSRLFTVRFLLPCDRQTVTENGMAAHLISERCEKYPEPEKLRRELKKLCGADIGVSFEKLGDNQLITFSLRALSDRFGIDGEPCFTKALDVLYNLIFLQGVSEEFEISDVERTRRVWSDKLDGDLNDKRIYAKSKAENIMYGDEGYGIPHFGYRESMEKSDGKTLYNAYRRLLENAMVRLTFVGEENPEEMFKKWGSAFPDTPRVEFKMSISKEKLSEPKRVTERMDVTQGKLVMGFTTSQIGGDRETAPRVVFTDLFGGGPYSNLFSVVREKMSLCYYCSARTTRIKGIMTVESGVEEKNAEAAAEAILAQLDEIRKGNFSDEQLKSSKLSICESLRGAADRIFTADSWYGQRLFDKQPLSPEEFAELISGVTREEIIECAKDTALDTVYFLLTKENKND